MHFPEFRTSQIKKFSAPQPPPWGKEGIGGWGGLVGASGVTKISKYYLKENGMPKKRLDAALVSSA